MCSEEYQLAFRPSIHNKRDQGQGFQENFNYEDKDYEDYDVIARTFMIMAMIYWKCTQENNLGPGLTNQFTQQSQSKSVLIWRSETS